jgi:branched-chain amino acid transport system substrate-binding protein
VREVNDLEMIGIRGLSRRRALKLFAATSGAAALAPALAACGATSKTASRAAQTLRIGLVVPQSGPLQEVGFEMHNGFSLYLIMNNNQIAGMDAAVTVIDEGTSVPGGIAAVHAALTSNAYDVLVGVANSQVMAGIPDLVTTARMPLIGSNGSPVNMRPSVFIWRTSFVAGEASTALAAYVAQLQPGVEQPGELQRPGSVAVYQDSSADAAVEAQAFTDTLGGSSIVIHQVTGAPSAPGVMSQLQSLQPDLVYAAVSGSAANGFVAAYRRARISAPLCGPGSLTEHSTQPAAAAGVFTSMNYAPDLNNDANETFISAYFAQYPGKIPTTYAMTSYDAAAVLDTAIAAIDVDDDVTPAAINVALGTFLSIDSPRGRWQFNQSRTPLQQWYLRQVSLDGEVLDNTILAGLETLT